MKKIKFQGPFYKKSIEQFSPIVSRAFRLYANQLAKKPHQPGKSTITGGEIIGAEPPPRPNLRYQFWDQLLEYAKPKTDLHAKIKTSKYDWIGRRIHGLWYNYVVGQHQSRVELWIDNGKNTEAENKEIFDKLVAAKAEIEQIFGGPLEWRRMDGKKACCIRKQITLGGYRDDEQAWHKIHEAMVDAMIRLHAALSPHL
jgi:hypothetical protein